MHKTGGQMKALLEIVMGVALTLMILIMAFTISGMEDDILELKAQVEVLMCYAD
jgi:hypothetical protein